jgi:hypothetical protein
LLVVSREHPTKMLEMEQEFMEQLARSQDRIPLYEELEF